MALSSQQPRFTSAFATKGSLSSFRRRRKRRQLKALAAAVLVVGSIVGFVVYKLTTQPAPASAAPAQPTPPPTPSATRTPNTPPPSSSHATPPVTQPTRAASDTDNKSSTPLPTERLASSGRADASQPAPTPSTQAPSPTSTLSPPIATDPAQTQPTTTDAATPPAVRALVQQARQLEAQNKLVDARALINQALLHPSTPPRDRDAYRRWLEAINATLVFSPAVIEGDPFASSYTVQSGDSLSRIASRQNVQTDWRLIQRINNLPTPQRIRVGQSLKLLQGPFHAVVDKSDYRVDIYAGPPPSPSPSSSATAEPSSYDDSGVEPSWTYIASYTVGLGEGDSTPAGDYVVRPSSKLVNPTWINPRTRERFDADDPENPIGERWLGIDPVRDITQDKQGLGLHGTIDPDSIGKQKSMGCVRLADDDIALVYEMLVEGTSAVRIRD